MAQLVTLTVAKQHLGITHTDADADIFLKVVQASDIVMAHLNTATTWTTATVPTPVQAAVLMVLTHLLERKGDDEPEVGPPLSEAAVRILVPWRTGALA